MRDKNTARKSKPRTGGRPFGSITKFPGSCVFAAEHGCNVSHLYRVLTGERVSHKLTAAYAAWVKKNGLPYPEAAVKPTRRAA